MCSEWCFSKRNVDVCAALCFFLLTDSVVTEPCNVTSVHTDIWVGRLLFKKKTKNNPSTRKTKSLASLSCCIPSHWQKMSCECWGTAFARPFLKPPAGARSRGWDSFPVFPRAWHQLESFRGWKWWQSGSTISPAAFSTPCHSEPHQDLLFWWNVTRSWDKRRGAFLNPGKIGGREGNTKNLKCKGVCLIKSSPVRSILKDLIPYTLICELFFFFLIQIVLKLEVCWGSGLVLSQF